VIVLDASAAVELLLATRAGDEVEARLREAGGPARAPFLLDVEVASTLRRLVRTGLVPTSRGGEALTDLADLAVVRYAHGPLLPRVWELRDGLSAYDAIYVALAELLGAPLLTRDARLARTGGHDAAIELVAG
jgi:predicted nucleic acid-binding protein